MASFHGYALIIFGLKAGTDTVSDLIIILGLRDLLFMALIFHRISNALT